MTDTEKKYKAAFMLLLGDFRNFVEAGGDSFYELMQWNKLLPERLPDEDDDFEPDEEIFKRAVKYTKPEAD